MKTYKAIRKHFNGYRLVEVDDHISMPAHQGDPLVRKGFLLEVEPEVETETGEVETETGEVETETGEVETEVETEVKAETEEVEEKELKEEVQTKELKVKKVRTKKVDNND